MGARRSRFQSQLPNWVSVACISSLRPTFPICSWQYRPSQLWEVDAQSVGNVHEFELGKMLWETICIKDSIESEAVFSVSHPYPLVLSEEMKLTLGLEIR